MAKIVLKTNLANNTVTIPWVQVEATLNNTPKPAEITITPVGGYKITANDFSHGLLHSAIRGIKFVDGGAGRVIARVTFNIFTYTEGILSIILPINVKSQLTINSFK